ncbi:unnamed protein product [Nesidiocoris tenuis]|uniref:Uncharacterized protein n=1 Tax=Nesidiocoris tenuis TaxID=355587 RepID=A0A6H5HIF1_9HEMI|nr:unnamed protein product [Nesidiocoris tenuis]
MIEKLLKINIGLIWRFRHISAAGRSTGHFLWRLSRPIVTPVTYVVSLPSRTFRTVTTTPCWRLTSKDRHQRTDKRSQAYIQRHRFSGIKGRHTQTEVRRQTCVDRYAKANPDRQVDIPGKKFPGIHPKTYILDQPKTYIPRQTFPEIGDTGTQTGIQSQTHTEGHPWTDMPRQAPEDRHTQAGIPKNQKIYASD